MKLFGIAVIVSLALVSSAALAAEGQSKQKSGFIQWYQSIFGGQKTKSDSDSVPVDPGEPPQDSVEAEPIEPGGEGDSSSSRPVEPVDASEDEDDEAVSAACYLVTINEGIVKGIRAEGRGDPCVARVKVPNDPTTYFALVRGWIKHPDVTCNIMLEAHSAGKPVNIKGCAITTNPPSHQAFYIEHIGYGSIILP